MGKMHRATLAICCLAAAACSKKDKTAKTKVQIVTARTVSPGAVVSAALAGADETDLPLTSSNPGFFKTSFNPSSFKVKILGIGLCKQAMSTDGSCSDTKNSVYMSNTNVIELAGQTALNPLATFENTAIESSSFGDYKSATIGFQADVGAVTVSGSASVGGTPYALADQKVTPPTAVVSVNFPNTLTVSDKAEATFSILIDVESPVFLSTAGASGSTAIDDKVSIQIPAWAIIPYAGEGSPSVETYDVAFDTTELGTKGAYGLRVTVVKDSAGGFYGASWTPVYAEGYNYDVNVFQPRILENLLTVAGDGAYKLTTDPAQCSTSTANNVIACMTFAAFKLESHSGSVTIGATEYAYTATKR